MVNEGQAKSRTQTIKFLCSYGGQILPRPGDGLLRYVGGVTRVLAVDRSTSFTELMVKLVEFCGFSVELRCQLPNGDLETLVSIKSEEELTYMIKEYDEFSPGSKIRAILSSPKSLKKISPPASKASSIDFSPTKSSVNYYLPRTCSPPVWYKGHYRSSRGQDLLFYNHRCCSYWH